MRMNASYMTEIYVSDAGYLVLEQECQECGKQTKLLLSPDQTEILFNEMPKLMMEQNQNWSGFSKEL